MGQFCHSFWQTVKRFKFEAKKVGGGAEFDPPLMCSRFKQITFAMCCYVWLPMDMIYVVFKTVLVFFY